MSWKQKIIRFKEKIKNNKNKDINFFNSNYNENNDNLDFSATQKRSYGRKIFTNFRRRNTTQIIKYLESKNIFNCFFYTDIENLLIILQQGIRPTKFLKLLPKQEYSVWTYLEHSNYLELELSSTSRLNFWKWCTEQSVNLNQVVIISVNITKLFQYTNHDWGLNLETSRLQIYEIIPANAIDWILLNDKKHFNNLLTFIDNEQLNIKLFKSQEKENLAK